MSRDVDCVLFDYYYYLIYYLHKGKKHEKRNDTPKSTASAVNATSILVISALITLASLVVR